MGAVIRLRNQIASLSCRAPNVSMSQGDIPGIISVVGNEGQGSR